MKIIVGLGNPGEKFIKTRHNAGYILIDKLIEKLKIDSLKYSKKFLSEVTKTKSWVIAKPKTYMNKSGKAISSLINFYHISPANLWVVHDDLDIDLGDYKIQFAKGPKVHKGLESINKALGTDNYWRVRIGIENRPKLSKTASGEEYVLGRFGEEEFKVLNKVVDDIIDKLIQTHDK